VNRKFPKEKFGTLKGGNKTKNISAEPDWKKYNVLSFQLFFGKVAT
jgi:hypothetical protein